MKSLLRQGTSFVIVGLIQLMLDWAVFSALYALGVAVTPANIVGRISGAALGFWLNGVTTFRGGDGARLGSQRLARFALVWLALTGVSSLAMRAVADQLGDAAPYLAKPLVEAVLALVSFVLARHYIYR